MPDSDEDPGKKGLVAGRHAPVKQERAVRLRREMTPAETFLWERLRGGRLGGLHFRRQQVVDGLIADFYCHAAGVVVECDGPIHDTQREHDEDRDAILRARDLCVLRFTNEEVTAQTNRVLTHIHAVCRERIK